MYIIYSNDVYLKNIEDDSIITTKLLVKAKKYITPLDLQEDLKKLNSNSSGTVWKYKKYEQNKILTYYMLLNFDLLFFIMLFFILFLIDIL